MIEVEDLAVDGIWLHEAWPQDGRQSHNIHMKKFVLNACELDLCILKGLQPDTNPWHEQAFEQARTIMVQ